VVGGSERAAASVIAVNENYETADREVKYVAEIAGGERRAGSWMMIVRMAGGELGQ